MRRYKATVRVKGVAIRTVVYAENSTHARLILQYQFGFTNLLTTPQLWSD
jgi:hypothetical protein